MVIALSETRIAVCVWWLHCSAAKLLHDSQIFGKFLNISSWKHRNGLIFGPM